MFCHRPDFYTPLEETCRAMSWLVEKGKTLYWGTSDWPADMMFETIELCERLNLHKPVVVQPEYNMLMRERHEKEYSRLFELKRLGSTIWSPLGGGVLAGKYNDGKKTEGGRYATLTNPIFD